MWKKPHVWIKNSHRLSHISWRILCSKQRILQSLTPNEHPDYSKKVKKTQILQWSRKNLCFLLSKLSGEGLDVLFSSLLTNCSGSFFVSLATLVGMLSLTSPPLIVRTRDWDSAFFFSSGSTLMASSSSSPQASLVSLLNSWKLRGLGFTLPWTLKQ